MLRKYLLIAKLSIEDLMEYKVDFILSSAKYSLMVVLMAIVWLAVEKNGQVGIFDRQQTVNYFIWSAALYTLSNFHPWYVEDDIRLGYLSKYLLKPISTTAYYFCYELARVATETVIKLVIFLGLLSLLHLIAPINSVHFFLLVLYMPLIFLFSFQWLTLISLLAFWVTEAYAIRWSATILTRLLSGVLVPILYFPELMQRIFFYLPFQHLAFSPIEFMLGRMSYSVFLQSALILGIWTVIFSIVRQAVWKSGLRQYEGTGI